MSTGPSLESFVWGTVHVNFFKRKAVWFDVMDEMNFAMWWLPPGTTISPDDAMRRLKHFNDFGPTKTAFGWQHAPDAEMWKKLQHSDND